MSALTGGLEKSSNLVWKKSPSQLPLHKAPTRFLSLSQHSYFHLVHLATVFCSFNWSAVATQTTGDPAFLFIQLRDTPSHSLWSTESKHKINKILSTGHYSSVCFRVQSVFNFSRKYWSFMSHSQDRIIMQYGLRNILQFNFKFNNFPTRCDLHSLLHFCRQLYMFRVLTPIIRSSYKCKYSFWY